MAKKVSFSVDIDTTEATKEVDELNESLETTGEKAEGASDGFNKMGKSGSKLGGIFKKMGTALKGMGLGVLLTAFAGLTSAMRENQKVADLWSTSWGTVTNAFHLGINTLVGGGEKVSSIGEMFAKAFSSAKMETTYENVIAKQSALLELQKANTEIVVEQQRQIRDNINLTYDERLKANKQISEHLEALIVKTQELAHQRLRAAQAEYRISKSVENEVALYQAQSEYSAALVWIETQRSEQKRNQVMLTTEQTQKDKEASQAQLDALAAEQAKAEEYHRKQMEWMEKEAQRQDELRAKRTEARLAELESEWAMQAETANIWAEVQTLVDETWLEGNMLKASSWDREKEMLDAQYQYKVDHFDKMATLWEDDAAKYDYYIAQKNKAEQEWAKESVKREKAVAAAKVAAISQSLAMGAQMFEEGTVAHKAFAVAQAVMNTFQGATMALGSAPPPYSYILMAMTIAMGLVSVKKILSTDPKAGGGGGGSAASAPAVPQAAPQNIGIMGGDSINQLSETVQGALAQPQKAYVTTTDINNNQQLDRHIEQNATL